MNDKAFIFLGGLHRSGTSLLHEIIRAHEQVNGFSDTGVPEDEGQHLQSVYPSGRVFGGPGKFAFDQGAYMDETHPLATTENIDKLLADWGQHLDLSSPRLIEKSPPNLIRTRFFQQLFPNSQFIIILRHPLAVAHATQKWSKTSIASLVEHSLRAHEAFLADMPHLKSVYVLRYEDFILNPQTIVDEIFAFLGLDTLPITHDIKPTVNDKYFAIWEESQKKWFNRIFNRLPKAFEARANKIGYSLEDYRNLPAVPWLGAHQNTVD